MTITHGKSRTAEYKIWHHMIRRCDVRSHKFFKNYGGRGIKVCDRWRDFASFYEDMGPRPSPKHTIDRKDNDGDYEPRNCRWATRWQQNQNTRKSVIIEHDGECHSMSEWARRLGMSRQTLRLRLKNGWSVEDALTPKGTRRAHYRVVASRSRATFKDAAERPRVGSLSGRRRAAYRALYEDEEYRGWEDYTKHADEVVNNMRRKIAP